MHSPSFIVCVFCVTSGQNGENLGSDEEEIVLLAYLLYDVVANKVVDAQHHHVKPTQHDTNKAAHESFLTEECRIQTGIDEDNIRNAQNLQFVLAEFERFLIQHQLLPEQGSRPFCLCTDGQLHLRMCLVPEATHKDIALPSFFFRFFDLRREFKKFYKTEDRPMNCLHDMFDFLGQEYTDGVEYGVKHCRSMAVLLHRLISEGHVFTEAECIKDKLEPGVCGKDELVDDDTVVRARGLPWQSSDQDIARFFRGLNVERGGVALCLSPQGRRNGEALIRFESREHRDLALRKHKHHIGQRYIEVYRASGEDFVGVAGGSSTEAQEFLSRHSDGGCQVIVRMRGLPYVCKAEQVLEFFKEEPNSVPVLDGEEGVLFVHQADGRATGDAFVLFPSDEDAAKALQKHRQCIGTRYIELFKSTTAEVQQVLNRSLDPRATSTGSTSAECMDITLPSIPPIIATFPAAIQPATSIIFPPQMTGTSKKDCIMIKGLPLEAQVNDILAFLGDHSKHVVAQGVHLVYNPRGTPFGEALIQMDCELSAELACMARNKKTMYTSGGKKNSLEVAQYSMDEISLLYNSNVSAVMSPRMVSTFVCNVTPTAPTLPILIPPNVPPPPLPSNPIQNHPIVPVNRQMLASPNMAQSFIAPGDTTLLAPAALYNATSGGLYAFHQPPANHPSFGAIHSLAPQTSRGPMTIAPAQPSPYTFQPIVYWYSGTPISPQNTFYVSTFPTTVLIKGLPATAQQQDVFSLLEGHFETTPDVQILRGQDGRATGDAYVTFASRHEAERVIHEHDRKMFGNRIIEMFIV